MGIAIGYQPETAVSMLSDVGPGTPQRFLWFGAQDTEMPDEMYEWPDHLVLPPESAATGVIRFPMEIKRWLRAQTRGKHRGDLVIDPMDSHEPLMRCKLAALLCYLDGRMEVSRDDWVLGGMIWSVSCAIRNRLIRHRDAEESRLADEQRTARLTEATEIEVMRVSVSAGVERVARNLPGISRRMTDRFEDPKRYLIKKNIGRDKGLFDAAVSHAVQRGWIIESDGEIRPGPVSPGA
jgi:hypothetical protein